MKCHYIIDNIAGKVLIPGCWACAVSNDIQDCTCRSEISSYARYENMQYNKEVAKLRAKVKELEDECFRLQRIINNVNKKK